MYHLLAKLYCAPAQLREFGDNPLLAFRASALICAALLAVGAGVYYITLRGRQQGNRLLDSQRWQIGVVFGAAIYAIILAIWVWLQSAWYIIPW